MSGIAGKFFKQFGWTASLAVFASLVVARVLTPMMAAYILKPIVGTPRAALDGHLPALGRVVHPAPLDHLRRHHCVLCGLARARCCPTGFIPPDDNSQTQVYLELPLAPRWPRPVAWPKTRASAWPQWRM